MLDADLARLYAVSTKALNQAAQAEPRDFGNFAFQLTALELRNLRSQIATSSVQGTDQHGETSNRSQFVTGSQKHRSPHALPWVFNEYGALMAANVLRSEDAARISVYVVRAFVHLREEQAANAAILKRLAEIDRTLFTHDSALRDIYRKLLPLLQPLPDPPKRRIGFRTGDD